MVMMFLCFWAGNRRINSRDGGPRGGINRKGGGESGQSVKGAERERTLVQRRYSDLIVGLFILCCLRKK